MSCTLQVRWAADGNSPTAISVARPQSKALRLKILRVKLENTEFKILYLEFEITYKFKILLRASGVSVCPSGCSMAIKPLM